MGLKTGRTKFGSYKSKILYHLYPTPQQQKLGLHFLCISPTAPYTEFCPQHMMNKYLLTKIVKLVSMSWPQGSLKPNYNEQFYKNTSF